MSVTKLICGGALPHWSQGELSSLRETLIHLLKIVSDVLGHNFFFKMYSIVPRKSIGVCKVSVQYNLQ